MILPSNNEDLSSPILSTISNGFARKGSIPLHEDFTVLNRIFWAETDTRKFSQIKLNLFTYIDVIDIIHACDNVTILPDSARIYWQKIAGSKIKTVEEVKKYSETLKKVQEVLEDRELIHHG